MATLGRWGDGGKVRERKGDASTHGKSKFGLFPFVRLWLMLWLFGCVRGTEKSKKQKKNNGVYRIDSKATLVNNQAKHKSL